MKRFVEMENGQLYSVDPYRITRDQPRAVCPWMGDGQMEGGMSVEHLEIGYAYLADGLARNRRRDQFWRVLCAEAKARGLPGLSSGECDMAWAVAMAVVCGPREGPLTREEWEYRSHFVKASPTH